MFRIITVIYLQIDLQKVMPINSAKIIIVQNIEHGK
jgi:hypothetical protein